MSELSIILIAKNEAENIRRCLDSVRWADEIIVVDSGSEDDTLKIAREYTPHVFSESWHGFGRQKNIALNKASKPWVFSIDADEWLTPEGVEEIKSVINHAKFAGYHVPRRNSYCGQFIKYGDVGRDKVLRLFKREAARFSDDRVHERVIVDGSVGELKHFILHDSYRDLEDLMERMNRYTTLSAEARFKAGKQASLWKAFTHSVWAFIKSYFIRRGFMDGRMGFIVAVSSAESSYYRYAKLWLMRENRAKL